MTLRTDENKIAQSVNLRTLAQHLELSQTTVSLVLNNAPAARSIPETTRQRIREAAHKLQYKPNYFARSLRSSRSQSVGILAPDLSEGFFTLVMNGVQQVLMQENYFYFTACHNRHPERLTKYQSLLSDRSVDGFLLLSTQTAIEVQVPVVGISSHIKMDGITNIHLDHENAAYLALDHLYALGHRAIAFMRGFAQIPDSKYRWHGIQSAVARLGIKINPELVIELDRAVLSPQIGYEKTQELLARNVDFTALFCFNDISAIGALRALDAAGKRVPEGVSVIGFDDVISASYIRPSLTTVRQPLLEMGKRGAEVLLERIAHPELEYPAEILFQPELLIRESTGPVTSKTAKK